MRVDCDAGMSTWSVDSYNYVEDYCESGTWDHKTNVGTEYDWLRFFWDLDAVEGLSTTNIATIVDEADMDSCDDSLAYTHADACANRLGTAAVDNGWFWDQYFIQIGAGHDFVTGS